MKTNRLLFFAAAVLVLAAGCGGPANVVWKQVIDSGGDETAVALASDGTSIYVAGTAAKPGAADRSTWLIQKFTKDGKEVWGQVYPRSTFTAAGGIAVDKAGSVYMAGRTTEQGKQMCVIAKHGADNGSILWLKALLLGDKTYGTGVCTMSGDRIAVCGAAGTEANSDYMVAVLSARDGQTVWTKNIDLTSTDFARRIACDNKDNLIVIGKQSNKDNTDIVLIKLNAKGDTLWTRVYDSGGNDEPGDVAFDPIGDVVATGTAVVGDTTKCVILEYDPDGGAIRKTAYGKNALATGRAIYCTPDGDIFIAGQLLKLNGGSILAFRYDPYERVIWERTVDMGKPSTAEGLYADKDVYVAGTVDNKTRDIVVMRLSRPIVKPPPAPTN